jgi:hypothetical protein
MKKLCCILFLFFCVGRVVAAPTYADLAVLTAKGYFKDHVPSDASVGRCVAFLNDLGIRFSLFDVMDPAASVTEEDFARVLGQMTLLFQGEADVVKGVVRLPDEADSWIDFCLLNDIKCRDFWINFNQRLKNGPSEEARRFFSAAE